MKWKMRFLNLAEIWHDNKEDKQTVLKKISEYLKNKEKIVTKHLGFDAWFELEEITLNIEEAEQYDTVEDCASDIYDWADTWRVWIEPTKQIR